MRTFVIFPKDKAEKIEASTKVIALKRYLKLHPEARQTGIAIAYEGCVCMDAIVPEITEIKEQGVVITETPKQVACGPEDSKPVHKDVN